MTSSLLALLLLTDVVCGTYALGRLLLGKTAAGMSLGNRFLFAVPLGIGALGYVLFALGWLHLFRFPVFAVILGLCLIGGVPILLRDLLRRDSAAQGLRTTVAARAGIAILILLGVCTLVAALAPPTNLEWDSLSYHLAAPKVYVRLGRIAFIPYDHHSNFPFTLQMLYTLMLGVGSEAAAKTCHWLCGALLIGSVAAFARRHMKEIGAFGAILAALLLAATPMVAWEQAIAYSDLATALFVWLSIFALFNAAEAAGIGENAASPEEHGSLPWLRISAILMGFALGTKYTVIAYWAFLLVGILGWNYLLTRKWAKETVPHAALWGGLSLLVASPWYIKNVLVTGNPVYPFAYKLFGGRYWSQENNLLYQADQAALGLPKTAANFLLDPWKATMLPDAAKFTEYYALALSPWWMAIPVGLLLLGKWRPSRVAVALLLFGFGVYAAWFLTVEQTRYIIAALPPLSLVAAEGLVMLWRTTRAARWPAAAMTALCVAWGIYVAGGLAFWGVRDFAGNRVAAPAWPVVAGLESRDDFIHRHAPGYGPAELWINANTPLDAKVAIFDDTRGYYLNRPYAWAPPNHAAGLFGWEQYRSANDWLTDFKRRGYTTLLVGEHDPTLPDDHLAWRGYLDDAIREGKVALVDEEPAGVAYVKQPDTGEQVPVRLTVRVYRIL